MVYFNCGVCGTGLRKNQVEQHMNQCRSKLYSCIDCQKDFRNNEYKAHNKCLTESERYESKSFVSKANKGELKQNAWFETVLKAVESFKGSPRAKQLLEKLTDYPNVPRKRAKFLNFMKNSFRSFGVNDKMLEEIWAVIEKFDQENKSQAQQQQQKKPQNQQENGDNKRKSEEENSEETNKKVKTDEAGENAEKFDWIESIKNQCQKSSENQIDLCKLQKKIFKKYKKHKNADESEEASFEKFIKKLNKKINSLESDGSITKITSTDDDSIFVKLIN